MLTKTVMTQVVILWFKPLNIRKAIVAVVGADVNRQYSTVVLLAVIYHARCFVRIHRSSSQWVGTVRVIGTNWDNHRGVCGCVLPVKNNVD